MVVAALDGRADLFERLTRREIADAGIGHPCWGRDLHPLEWQLASLHGQTPPTSPSASHSGCTSMTGCPRTKMISLLRAAADSCSAANTRLKLPVLMYGGTR